MKRLTVILSAVVLGFSLLSLPSILQARGGFGGHGGRGGHHVGFHHGHSGFHGRFFFDFGVGFWPGPFYWGAPIVGWPYGGWPYATYAGWPYVGWPYYPPQATEAAPPDSQPQQQQPYYWYYCENPQGYYPYVKSCPGGWKQVIPNITPPSQ